MDQFLTLLYGASGVAAAALYLPQIRNYHCDPLSRKSISLVTWGGWIAIACITIVYALCVINNMLIATIAGLNIIAQLTVLAYGLGARMTPASPGPA